MQLFIDNWSTVLTAAASSDAVTLAVDPSKAALLTGLVSGAFYRLTLVEVNEAGIEVAWEVVKVLAVAGGVLTVERMVGAREWAEGTQISARLTAASLAELSGVDAGVPPVVLSFDVTTPPSPAAIGQLMIQDAGLWVAHDVQSEWGWKKLGQPTPRYGLVSSATPYQPGSAPLSVLAAGCDFYVSQIAAGATGYDSIRIPVLPSGAVTLDPLVFFVRGVGVGAAHALRIYDDGYAATGVMLVCRAGVSIQTARQPEYIELTTSQDVVYELNLDYSGGVQIIARPNVETVTYGLGREQP